MRFGTGIIEAQKRKRPESGPAREAVRGERWRWLGPELLSRKFGKSHFSSRLGVRMQPAI